MELKLIKRTTFGLVDGVDYIFNEKGLVDWRRMVRPEFLVVNKQAFDKQGKTPPLTIDKLEDKDLLILLAGIKDLARLRGYTSVKYAVQTPCPDYVVATCTIQWSPNFETESFAVEFSAIGDAGLVNTNGFGRLYLGPIAENRAFVRCVRNFLGVNIVGQDELAPKSADEAVVAPQTSPAALLEKLMTDKAVTFADLKAKLIAEQYENAESFATLQDVPKVKVFELIERLKKKSA